MNLNHLNNNNNTKTTNNETNNVKINFKALFAGETLVTPVMFNPTLEQKIKLTKASDKYAEILRASGEINYVRTMGTENEEYRIISLLCKFNPNEMTESKSDSKYQDEVFTEYRVAISDRFVPKSKKDIPTYMIIDNKLNTTWVPLSEISQKGVDKAVKEYNTKMNQEGKSFNQMCEQSSRLAYQGEYQLLSLINTLAGKSKFNYSAAIYQEHIDDIKLNEKTNPNKAKMLQLKDYKIALNTTDKLIDVKDHQKNFLKLVKGDVSQLNGIFDMKNEGMSMFRIVDKETDEVRMNKLGVLLYANRKDTGDFKQSILDASGINSIASDLVFSERTKARKSKYQYIDTNGNKSYKSSEEDTRLTKEMLAHAMKSNQEYPHKGYVRKGTLAFGEFLPNVDYVELGMSSTNVNFDDLSTSSIPAANTDDLPF